MIVRSTFPFTPTIKNPFENIVDTALRVLGMKGNAGPIHMESVDAGSQQGVYENSEPLPLGKTSSTDGGNLALKSVSVRGTLRGMLFSCVLRQEYRNDTKRPAEIIYTFPAGWHTALLGMKAKIGSRELDGKVVEKAEAEESYEEAISKGDSAILVQKSAPGLYTANIGNVSAGETVIVELHCARLLDFDGDRIRLCIPTVVGERYGDQHAEGGLARHEKVTTSASASYAFRLDLTLEGDIAEGHVSCPSHEIKTEAVSGGLKLTLARDAVLDRDFVLLMSGIKHDSHAQYMKDGKRYMVAASFAPRMEREEVSPIAVKILVDCSGSMSGSRISQACKGLTGVINLLQPKDMVSFSCFGSEIKNMFTSVQPCTPEVIRNISRAIDATDADMGGTEMEGALQSVFSDVSGPEDMLPAVLLITDGDVWNVKNIIATAKKSGHRVFAIGVGAAPGESLLREMAEKTGGACEFVTGNENMAAAVVRMFKRMRGGIAGDIRVDWGQPTVWHSHTPHFIYDNETVHCFALFDTMPENLPALSWKCWDKVYTSRADKIEPFENGDLTRMGRLAQFEECEDRKEKLEIALGYQLVTDMTSLILVDEKPDGEKIKGLPEVMHVAQMPVFDHGCAAGTKGFIGSAMSCFASQMFISGSIIDVPTFCNVVDGTEDEEQGGETGDMVGLAVEWWLEKVKTTNDVMEIMDPLMNMPVMKSAREFLLQNDHGLPLVRLYALFILWALEQEKASRHDMRPARKALLGVDDNILLDLRDELTKWSWSVNHRPGWMR